MMDTTRQARFQPSGLNTHFNGENDSFAEYVTNTRDMLCKNYLQQGIISAGKKVDGNVPFELKPSVDIQAGKTKPYQRGILLTHGLSDSPYFMRYLGEFFQAQGFRVMAVLLPGHGTQPGDLLGVTWQEWLKVVRYGADKLDEEVEEIYLGGFSAGGALSLYQSLSDTRVRGLFLFSPALKITSRAAFASWHKLYSWLIPSAKWVDIQPDSDIYKYESLTKNAVAQMYQLIKQLNAKLKIQPLNIPVFVAASRDDVTVDYAATQQMIEQSLHPLSRLVCYAQEKPDSVESENIEWVGSAFPGKRILSSSHHAIVLSPHDTHYGVNGEYANCVHYYPHNMAEYEQCKTRAVPVLQGEITPENLQIGTLKRLMYNPNFEALKISMRKFIESLNEVH